MGLESRFEQAVREACIQVQHAGYYPSRFIEKMDRIGAVAYAKQLVTSGELQSGLRRLKELELLDLSIEHFVGRDPDFASLFTKGERDAANWRLDQIEME